jgi:hypothetical protein
MHVSVINSVGIGGMLRHFHWKSGDKRGIFSVVLDTLEEVVD